MTLAGRSSGLGWERLSSRGLSDNRTSDNCRWRQVQLVFLSKIPTNLVGFCGPFLCLENIDGSPAAIVRFNAVISDKAGNGANEWVKFLTYQSGYFFGVSDFVMSNGEMHITFELRFLRTSMIPSSFQ